MPKHAQSERLVLAEKNARDRLFSPRSEVISLGYDVSAIPENGLFRKGPSLYYRCVICRSISCRTGFLRRVTGHIKAVDGISFNVYRGQTLGLVGESGCGKTTTGRALMRLISFTGGEFDFNGIPWSQLSERNLRPHRRKLQIVFQDPYASLNPRMTVEAHLTEAMAVHQLGANKNDRRDMAAQLLVEVGLKEEHLPRYPHEFSGVKGNGFVLPGHWLWSRNSLFAMNRCRHSMSRFRRRY